MNFIMRRSGNPTLHFKHLRPAVKHDMNRRLGLSVKYVWTIDQKIVFAMRPGHAHIWAAKQVI